MTDSLPGSPPGGRAPRRRILVAEPSPAEREHLTRLLGGPFAVEAVSDVARAAEAVLARRPDLVLADAGLHAAGLSRRLDAEPEARAIPILLLGAPGRDEPVAGERLARPVAASELLAEVRARLAPAGAPAPPDGPPEGDARIQEAEARGRRSAERAVIRVTLLQALTAALSRAVTPEEVAGAIVHEGRRALDAAATIVVLREGAHCLVVAAEGYPDDVVTVGARFPLGLATPLAGVVRTGRPVWLERPAVGDAARIAARSGLLTGAALPLRVGGATIGALGYRYRDATRPVPASERAYLGTVAELCAQALERARLYAPNRPCEYETRTGGFAGGTRNSRPCLQSLHGRPQHRRSEARQSTSRWSWSGRIALQRFVGRTITVVSTAFQIGVCPVKIDVGIDFDFHDLAMPLIVFLDVILEELDVVFPHRRSEQHAQIAERLSDVLGRTDLRGVYDPADPDFIKIGMILSNCLKLTVSISAPSQ